jgi:glycosyltransferase involved in cell wall biosynthesis
MKYIGNKKDKKDLKIGFPLSLSTGGPSLFMTRLRHSISKQRLAQVSTFVNPFTDINVFSNKVRSIYRKPYVFRVDGIYFDKSYTSGSNHEKNKPIFQGIDNATGLIIQSNFDYNLISVFHKRIKKPYDIINNGVNIKIFSPTGPHKRGELSTKDEDIVFITSANWRIHKRLKDVINVFLKFEKNTNRTCHLLILGKNSNMIHIKHPRIYNIGFVPPKDLPNWYRTGNIFLFLSWLDHCPNSIVEAIACGLPVVCTNQGGSRELIEMTNGGIVAQADEEFTFEPIDLYNPPTPNYQNILQAIDKILTNYDEHVGAIDTTPIDIDNIAKRYVKFIQNLPLKN